MWGRPLGERIPLHYTASQLHSQIVLPHATSRYFIPASSPRYLSMRLLYSAHPASYSVEQKAAQRRSWHITADSHPRPLPLLPTAHGHTPNSQSRLHFRCRWKLHTRQSTFFWRDLLGALQGIWFIHLTSDLPPSLTASLLASLAARCLLWQIST